MYFYITYIFATRVSRLEVERRDRLRAGFVVEIAVNRAIVWSGRNWHLPCQLGNPGSAGETWHKPEGGQVWSELKGDELEV